MRATKVSQGDDATVSPKAMVGVSALSGGVQVVAFLGFCVYLYIVCTVWPHGIFFYKSVISLLLFAMVASFLFYWLGNSTAFGGILRTGGFHPVWFAITNGMVHFLLVLIFLLLIPVVVDRSVSVFLLGSIYRAGRAVSEPELERRFVVDYVGKYGAVSRRIDEQIASGNIERTAGGYRLTDQGQLVIGGMRRIAQAFSLDRRLIDPETDIDNPN